MSLKISGEQRIKEKESPSLVFNPFEMSYFCLFFSIQPILPGQLKIFYCQSIFSLSYPLGQSLTILNF